MRRYLGAIGQVVMLIASLGCGTSPTAPAPTAPAQFDPAALFAALAGPYTLTFEADAGCPLPPSLEGLTYDVVLEPSPFPYLGIRVPGKAVVGDLWVLAGEGKSFMLRWNVDCEAQDTVRSTSFYLCGEGAAFAAEGTIAGVFIENVYFDVDLRPLCANGAHRFKFQRRSSTVTS